MPAKKSGTSRGRLAPFVLGFAFALVVVVAGGWAYLRFGRLPVATADAPFPLEAQIVQVPLGARIARELQTPPFGASEDAFETGARIYKEQCSSCHGLPGQDVLYADSMYPRAPQLWKKHKLKGSNTKAIVGVSDDEPGESYWKIKHGIRLTGMPSYQNILSDSDMWDVALLLKNADQPLPNPVLNILNVK
jgi:mono/diheme cytochrome c family protein